LIIVGSVFVLAIVGLVVARTTRADRATPSPKPTGHPIPNHPIIAAGQFSGSWHAHTTVVIIQANGQGSAQWPGPLGPGQSEATAVPGRANLRIVSLSGTHASALITDSTEPSIVPDGPVGLQVTNQDLLYVVPVLRTAVSPFDPISYGPAGLCGPKAAALTLAEQVAARINCGA